jgi:hypothetical protein
VNGARLTIQWYSHTPQGAGGSCEWPQRTSINPYSSRPLIPASGRTPVHSPPRTGGRAAPATYMRDGGIVRPNLHATQTGSICVYHASFKRCHRLRRPRSWSSAQHKLPLARALPPQLDRDLLALSRLPRGPSRWPRGRPSMRSGRVPTLDASTCTRVPLALPSC